MGQNSDWMRKLSQQMHTSMEPLPGIPLVELCGYERVLIENHKGIVQYGSDNICVKVKFGVIKISGEELQLAYMTSEKVVICGIIRNISLTRGCDI